MNKIFNRKTTCFAGVDEKQIPPASYRAGKKLVRAYAHRGGGAENSQNTDLALAHAAKLGYRFIETDVRLTRDGEVVLQHDESLQSPWGIPALISELTWEEFAGLQAIDGGKALRFSEVLERYPDVVFNVEPKCDEVIEPLLKIVAAAGAWERVCFSSFQNSRLDLMRRCGARTSASPREVLRLVLAAKLRCPRLARRGFTSALAAQVPFRYGPLTIVDRAFVAYAHRAGLRVEVWTIDDPQEMETLLDMGVDGIMTDKPTVLKTVLSARGQWQQERP